MVWVMLNPSVAGAGRDDATIRRCVWYARRGGCTAMTAVNLFGLVSTSPMALLADPDPVGELCDQAITDACTARDVTSPAPPHRRGGLGRPCRAPAAARPGQRRPGHARRPPHRLLGAGAVRQGQPCPSAAPAPQRSAGRDERREPGMRWPRVCIEPADLWVGAYLPKDRRTVYVCPLPCLVLRWDRAGTGEPMARPAGALAAGLEQVAADVPVYSPLHQ